MKLLSLNVALFEDNNSLISDFIVKENPDFLCLQEIVRPFSKTYNPSLTTTNTILRAVADTPHHFFGANWRANQMSVTDFHGEKEFHFDFGGTIDFGNFIVSKLPITFGQNVFIQNNYSYITDWSKWPLEDYRAVEVCYVQLPGGRFLQLLNYHGIWTQDKLGNQTAAKAVRQILKLAQDFNGPTIIAGDFNLFPSTSAMQPLNKAFQSLVDLYQIKTTRPKTNELSHKKRNVVDYIFVSPEIKIKSFAVLNEEISDHLPLILEFEV